MAVRTAGHREDFLAENLAAEDLLVGLGHEERFGVQIPRDVELSECPVPLAEDAEKLKQEDPVPGIGRGGPNFVLEGRQGRFQVSPP